MALAVVGACALTSCGETSGEKAASRVADEAADQLRSTLSSLPYSFDAAHLSFNAIPDPDPLPGPMAEEKVDIEAISARGDKTDKDGALIEVRIHAEVRDNYGASFPTSTHGPGRATKCYRLTVKYSRVDKDGISCPDGPVAALPTPTPAPKMPEDASALLTVAVRKTSASTVGADVRAAFPQKFITVDTIATEDKVIAAVGDPEHRDCIVAVRDSKGVHVYQGFDRDWLAPGETGCTTELITNPPR